MTDWLEKVHAYADGELDPAEKAEVERLIQDDPRARAEHAWAVQIRQTLRTKTATYDSSEAWKASVARLDEIDAVTGDKRVESIVGRFSWGIAAILLGVIVVAGVLNRGKAGTLSNQELAGLVSDTPFSQQQDIDSSKKIDEIARERLGADMPDIQPLLAVTHVSVGKIENRPVMKVDLADITGPMSLYIVKGVDNFENFQRIPGSRDFFGGTLNGLSCVSWTDSQFGYMVIADRSLDETLSIADDMRGSH